MKLVIAVVLAFVLAVAVGGLVMAVTGALGTSEYNAWCESIGGVAWNAAGIEICTVGNLPPSDAPWLPK